MNPTARRNARYYALQALYQWQIANNKIPDIESDFLTHHIKKKTDLDYFKDLLQGASLKAPELDQHIAPFLVQRTLSEIDPVEQAILRIAVYELAHRIDTPSRVIINEALELTKQFGSIEGFKFVNGILDQVAHTLRIHEMNRTKK